MMSQKYYDNVNRHTRISNSTRLFMDREYGPIDAYVQRRLHAAPHLIDLLELESMLKAHEGCVNCLEWSSDGRLLASGSDDFHVILWDPFRNRRVLTIHTKHLGNMFSVKFIPHNESLIATCAADKFVYVFDVNGRNDVILSCNCHSGRVKRLATAPDSPYMFWSAGEDGNILQLDLREQHRCRSAENRVGLINLDKYLGSNAEAKCVAINPVRTEMLAVGANDPYARIYDRRMLHPVSVGPAVCAETPAPELPKDCVTYYCPGHINKNVSKQFEHESRAVTYLTFNDAGTELLVNMGGEHIYLYDLQNAQDPKLLNLPAYVPADPDTATDIGNIPLDPRASGDFEATAGGSSADAGSRAGGSGVASGFGGGGNGGVGGGGGSGSRRKLPEHIEAFKKRGNEFLENERYLRAIEEYSEAITLAPDCPVLYLNRATAYMRRMWFGDVYAALRDCHEALRLDPSYIKAHFRLARALLELGRPQEADTCLRELLHRFPSYATNHGVMMLHKDIKENSPFTTQPSEPYNCLEMAAEEFTWRSNSKDYRERFVGHCNTKTDIKEANYFGRDGDFIVAGSDDRNFFLWERATGKIRAVYHADEAIVNCVLPHPDICMLATSGIDHDIKIWTPIAESAEKRTHHVSYIYTCVEENQQKMKTDPFDMNTRNAFCWSG